MAKPTLGFPGPTASTEVPLEMLAACHIRIAAQCATLKRLQTHLQTHGSDAQARKAANSVMRYFDTAAVDHHADEEENLFPALIESMAGSDAVCIRELIHGLTSEHHELERMWHKLRLTLKEVAVGKAALLCPDNVDQFTQLYARHIAQEEDEMLPMASRLLGDADLTEIGRAMRARRNIPDE